MGTNLAVPNWYWAAVLFLFGTMVGSFLNVCIHRMPRGESIVSPPSRCPHCGCRIPWALNIPLVTWLYLRGKCRNCGAPISVRYFLVELLTGLMFLASWRAFGPQSVALALMYCLLFSLFIVATFIDCEHYIIPDEITLGGMGAGFLCSLAVPLAQHATTSTGALRRSSFGIVIGGGLVYAIVRVGKLLFGKHRFSFPPDTKVTFTETVLQLPEREVPYEELFYRRSDAVVFRAKKLELYLKKPILTAPEPSPPVALETAHEGTPLANLPPSTMRVGSELSPPVVPEACASSTAEQRPTLTSEPTPPPPSESALSDIPEPTATELPDRTYEDVRVRLLPHQLCIGEEVFDPEDVARMVVVTDAIVVPREAMGFGDVKFMASIGAFLGAPAVVFSLLLSAMIGSLVGITLIALGRREWSSRLPYGPYIALAAVVWVFGGTALYDWWVGQLNVLMGVVGIPI
jgi:prepilin signal peptidase PulO-like enzyme (type II secretory pathway)